MKRKTGLYGLGLLVTAAALSISCSGDDGDGDSGGTSGSSTSGASTGGTPSASGNSSGGNSTSGASTAGNSSSGSNNGGSNNGGSNNGGNNNQGGDGGPDPQGGGGPGGEDCPDAADGDDCDRPGGFQNSCTNSMDETCFCGQNDEWTCIGDIGQGGGGPGGGDVTCPDNAMDDDECTGTGMCPGQQGCVCFNDTVNCFN